jgi:hypothetical protein
MVFPLAGAAEGRRLYPQRSSLCIPTIRITERAVSRAVPLGLKANHPFTIASNSRFSPSIWNPGKDIVSAPP